MEEDYTLISRMRVMAAVHSTVPRVRGLTGAQIHNIDPSDARLMAWLIETKVISG